MNATDDHAALCTTLANARARLLDQRGEHGHWEGKLSNSALSTATSICALDAYGRSSDIGPSLSRQLTSLVQHGRKWLAENQNSDGGWGDTTLSFSNISTTALCWAAFAGDEKTHAETVTVAERWLEQQAGGLEPTILAEAIRNRYGKDRTFSVPILTTLALTGRLEEGRRAWRQVPQLPFELAACPHQWFAALRLPVVSYALPALVAIGLVRHHHRPTRNPLTRMLRMGVRQRTLRVLCSIQPTSGGFLEATPLTSFVVLSLVGAGIAQHPVVAKGIDFLMRSVRDDGSWPIDTNLATWVTSLSIHALDRAAGAGRESDDAPLDRAAAQTVRDWLMGQQYRVEHPYTHAAPGGWAWTDLSGGVPDADDTPGALLALKALDDGSDEIRCAAAAGVAWLLDLQNSDGGMPTFCRGWGTLPFDRSSPDLTAHAIRAWLTWLDQVPDDLQARIRRAIAKSVNYLAGSQQHDGTWAPLWFGNQHTSTELNLTYGTSRVLLALCVLDRFREIPDATSPNPTRAVDWFIRTQNDDGGWGGASETPSSIEETSLAVEALSEVLASAEKPNSLFRRLDAERLAASVRRGIVWLLDATDHGRHFPPTPIGFYFAKLWYFEQLYPLVYSVAALGQAHRVRQLLFAYEPAQAGADR